MPLSAMVGSTGMLYVLRSISLLSRTRSRQLLSYVEYSASSQAKQLCETCVWRRQDPRSDRIVRVEPRTWVGRGSAPPEQFDYCRIRSPNRHGVNSGLDAGVVDGPLLCPI